MKPSFVIFSRTIRRGQGRVTLLRGFDAKRRELWCARGGRAFKMLNLVKAWGVEVRRFTSDVGINPGREP